mgnify:CR=1 FL=1
MSVSVSRSEEYRKVASSNNNINSATRKYHRNSNKKVKNSNSNNNNNIVDIPLIEYNECNIVDAPFTKEMFYEAYSKGNENISIVECPNNLNKVVFFKAPESYNEINRLNYVEKYMNLPHWQKNNRFNMLLNKMKELFHCNGSSISLIDSRHQIIKFEKGYGFDTCSRQISIDSHCILSKDFLLILDTSKDWRFKDNPIVKDFPFIKFYLGVPLITKEGYNIGVLSIFDSFSKNEIDESIIDIMIKMSKEIMEYLDSNVKIKNNVNNSYNNNNNNSKNDISNKMLLSTCLATCKDGKDSTPANNNIKKIFEIYGRATSNNKNNFNEIIFENDGSGNSYKYNSKIKFTKDCSIYEDSIDLNIWNKISKLGNGNFTKACKLVCESIVKKLNFDCVYILNIKNNEMVLIKTSSINFKEREIKLKDYQDVQSIERNDEYEEDLIDSKSKVISIYNENGDDNNSNESYNFNSQREFHNRSIKSNNGIVYYKVTEDNNETMIKYKSGISLPFFKYDTRLVRKQRMKKISNDKIEYFIKDNGYLITCLNENRRDITEEEIGYVYGCVGILRKIYIQE